MEYASHPDIIKRLKRAHGHLAGVIDRPPLPRFSRTLRGKITATQRRWADSRQG